MYWIIGGDQKEYGPVGAEEIRQWIAGGRANGQTLARTEEGAWKPLSTFPELADALGTAAATAPPPVGASVPASTPASVGARQMVHGPAVFLIVVGVLFVALGIFSLFWHLFGWSLPQPQPTGHPELDRVLELLNVSSGVAAVFDLFAIGISALIILGGYCLMKLRNYGLCLAVAIVALLPCVSPCCCLSLPAGVWALVVLSRPEVRMAFDQMVG